MAPWLEWIAKTGGGAVLGAAGKALFDWVTERRRAALMQRLDLALINDLKSLFGREQWEEVKPRVDSFVSEYASILAKRAPLDLSDWTRIKVILGRAGGNERTAQLLDEVRQLANEMTVRRSGFAQSSPAGRGAEPLDHGAYVVASRPRGGP